jgi:hypothetical protein
MVGESAGLTYPDRPAASGQLICGVGLDGLFETRTTMSTHPRFESQLYPRIAATKPIQSRDSRLRKPMR